MTGYYPIVGRKDTNAIFDRLAIEELQSKQPRQFTLFIIAYLAIQQRPLQEGIFASIGLKDPAGSFDAIAGIHGRPFTEWLGDQRPPAEQVTDFSHNDKKDTLPVPSRFGGYCNHGAVSFPPWHRPYVLLIEQSIGNIAKELAAQIESVNPGEKGLWTPAAEQLRFPQVFVSIASPRSPGLPPVLKEDTVKIQLLKDKPLVDVPNPLSYYPYFNGVVPGDFKDTTYTYGTSYFAQWKRTYRYADSTPTPPGSNVAALDAAFKEAVPGLRAKVVRLFTFHDNEDPAKTWDEFSNHRMQSKGPNDDYIHGSLEGVHDTVHSLVGGNGHMSDPDYAAFDPIFFLHHSNVDRLFALWEWCYSKYWMIPTYDDDGEAHAFTQELGTYHQVYNEAVTPEGDLAPFRNGEGTYWTSDQAHFLDPTSPNFYAKYYSYPNFQGIKVEQPATEAQRLKGRADVAKFYGYNPHQSVTGTHPSFLVPKLPLSIPNGFNVIPNYRPFVVQVQLREHAYGRAYNFHLTYKTALGAEKHVGSVSVFSRVDTSPCEGCAARRSAGSIVLGIIPITDSIVEEILRAAPANIVGAVATGIFSAATAVATGNFGGILGHIKGSLKGSLVDYAGQHLAAAEGGDGAAAVPQSGLASAKVTPVEISLASHAVASHPVHPIRILDVQNHGSIFSNGWAATHQDSRRR
ncbi:hypothetical protein SERLA73DRAFT_71478 [Serpula lacrymans var. lacrymans S7.3]|uniref:tyrosinase n=2 Tax=Serpula lacrymans var. lacrymans TaxID=341189 RepID=F8PR61_SERL3|nr:uncharacterized protein SERLADRAFT_435855 [Serpula lacrymans var. lacrymans S7.9]EGO02352.1 hypothetical protein SERLA73DRAFT_71478 [Serpula lacrymans var. lacrymans S7.3]EGO28084.1 hypothetical protein SERLADRAFT_435855 [Serpula lacrymans var. lacrymans S7.9]